MSFTNDLYRVMAQQRRVLERAAIILRGEHGKIHEAGTHPLCPVCTEEKAAAKVRALKEELPTANEMRAWHDGANPAERHNETPYPSE